MSFGDKGSNPAWDEVTSKNKYFQGLLILEIQKDTYE